MAVYLSTYRESVGRVGFAAVPFTYPGGELSLKAIEPETDERTVYIADVRGADLNELMTARLLADVAHDREMPFVLILPYLPAARADRGEPCGKYAYATFIETFGADQVITIDTHSTTGNWWYSNLVDLPLQPLLERALEGRGHWRYDAVIAPDKGAKDRAEAVAKHYGLDLIVADKTREFDTGKITDYKVPGVSLKGRYLVVDDICDGGWTFTLLASKSLLPKANLDLWVTHGVFSGAATNLRNYYGRIMTSDSHPGHNRVGVATTVVPTFQYAHDAMMKGLRGD